MATLVLNTVGTILGGPIGGAIGSFVGQSIDQQLFGPGAKHGPRLGDLSVQTSSYGSAIPQIFGSMRAAGTIVWATDLQEQAQTTSAKGQLDTVTYSYSASFAVALSSRPIESVGRIWADGKLIRDSSGQFALATDFRLHAGSEEQAIDPLIASAEGIERTPAYRGIALAVFENLQLAEFGNRIPFLTFEVIADPGPVAIGALLGEISEGAIACERSEVVAGYAAYGRTIRSAVQPLVDLWDIALFDDGSSLASPSAVSVPIGADEIGCTAGEPAATRSERSQEPATNLPTSSALAYYDRERAYQTGMARASLETSSERIEQVELPAVIEASAAKALVERSLARRWAERDKLKLRLPPSYLQIVPGSLLLPPGDQTQWRVEQVTVEGFAIIAELRPTYGAVPDLPADPGRVAPSSAAIPEPTSLAIVELPDDGSGDLAAPVVAVAATSAAEQWRPVPLNVDVAGTGFVSRSASAATVMGMALTALANGQSAIFDLVNSVDVRLAKASDWLESRDDDALSAGDNLALLGSELIQFGDAVPLGDGLFRLGRLLRGRRGTEWAMNLHSQGEAFVAIDPARLQRLPVSAAQKGARLKVAPGGLADGPSETVEAVIAGEAMRPPSPVRLTAVTDAGGALHCAWVRRSSRGWAWLDGVEAPLGSSVELYRATLAGSAGSVERTCGEPSVDFTAADLTQVGTGAAVLSVVQIGDLAASRPATLAITITKE